MQIRKIRKKKPRAADGLVTLLDLEEIEENLYRGESPKIGWQRVFGGQVIGQALVAAGRTVEDRAAHSLHAYFLRPGDPKTPILYQVERTRDGNSFTTRRVTAVQHGQTIFDMSVSFQISEPGFEHQTPMPEVPGPGRPSQRIRAKSALYRQKCQKISELIGKRNDRSS